MDEQSLNPTNLTAHPLADVFPPMSPQEYTDLMGDIRNHGQREPIWIDGDSQILDGKHRARACTDLEIPVLARTYTGDDPVAFVVSLNLKRRHLNESQRAMVAARVANMQRGDNQHAQICATSQSDAAERLGVSRRSVQNAAAVQAKATPELTKAVDEGRVSVSAAADVATLTVEEQVVVVAKGEAEILAKAKEIRAAKHKARKAERVEVVKTMDWPEGKYRVIYADPPWEYSNSGLDTSAAQHYETMSNADICAMDVKSVAAKDSILFMWATSPLLPEALAVIESWGFEYKTSFVWDKERPNYGFYNSVQHEFLLLAVRGSCTPDIDERIPSVVRIERTQRHSAKPDEFRAMIDKLYPHGPRIELFARVAAEGWNHWGNEVGVA